jgi:hypothetical protein
MSAGIQPNPEMMAAILMQRLHGFIQGIGMSMGDARFIVDRVLGEMPSASNDELEATARAWMLIALT